MNNTLLENYEFTVKDQNYIPNKENPEKIEMTVEFEYNGQKHELTPPAFKPVQIANGQWEQQVCIYIDDKVQQIKGNVKENVPNLEGESIQNSGYDNTGPKNSERYNRKN